MRPEERDAALLWDMMRYAQEVEGFVLGRSWEDYQRDPLLRRAVERSVSIVGEAAWKVSKTFRAAHPQVPWRPIEAQRHILVHDYGIVKSDKIWRVATLYIPELIRLVEPLLPPSPPDPDAPATTS